MPDELFLITPVNDNFRRDVELADSTLLDPNDPDCLIQGEWVVLDTATKKFIRPLASGRGCYQVFSPKGDLAAQALGKIAVIQLHEYEAETIVYTDAGGFTLNGPITVDIVPVDGVNRAGLRPAGMGDFVYGYTSKLPADNGNKLRFVRTSIGSVL